MERFNKVKIDESAWEAAKKSFEGEKEKSQGAYKYSTLDLFQYRGITKVTLGIGFNWFVNSMVYYGVSLSAGSLAGDIIMNNIYAGIFEITSYIICILVMDHVGRRLLLAITLNGAGLSLIAATIVNEYAGNDATLITLGVALSFIGKAFVSGSFAVVYNFTGELYPTVVRGNGIAFASMSARIGSIISPFIIQIKVSWLPNSIFGSLAVIAGLTALGFRDTTGRPMMETIEEAEKFYTGKDLPLRKEMDTVTHAYEQEVSTIDEKGGLSTAL